MNDNEEKAIEKAATLGIAVLCFIGKTKESASRASHANDAKEAFDAASAFVEEAKSQGYGVSDLVGAFETAKGGALQ